MTVLYSKPIQIDALLWRLAFTSDRTTPVTFRIYREGTLRGTIVSSTGAASYDFAITAGDFPFIEVLDNDADIAHLASPGHITLFWLRNSSAVKYRIEELVSAVWTLRAEVPDTGLGSYLWLSRWLEDVTTHQFRIIPVDSASNQGTALTFSVLMVRHPDPPNVSYTFNTGPRTVTIAAV